MDPRRRRKGAWKTPPMGVGEELVSSRCEGPRPTTGGGKLRPYTLDGRWQARVEVLRS